VQKLAFLSRKNSTRRDLTTTAPAQIIAVREVLNSTRRIDCGKAFVSQLRGCGAARGGAFWRELTRYIGLYHTRFSLLLTLSHAACGHPPMAPQVKPKSNATIAKARKKRKGKKGKEHLRPACGFTQTTRTRTPLLRPPPIAPIPPATPHPLHLLPPHSRLFLPSLYPHISVRPGNPGLSSA
jgi:hypothetical protein